MIKAIVITNHLDESIRLELTQPEKSGFVIQRIDGLGPVKADVNFTEMATVDGALINSSRIGTRNIVMSLLFLENPTIEETRLNSYKYFPNKRDIKFRIETDNRICETIGKVEDNVPTIFEKKEGCQISILCPDPYFYSVGNTISTFYGVDPLFEFPFSNESLTDNLIEFGDIKQYTEGNIYYEGDIEIGITIRIHAIGLASGITVYNSRTRETMTIDDNKLKNIMGSGIQAGDDIIITTSRGEKGIKILRGGVETNILNVLGKPIKWFQLSKGDNLFAYRATDGLANLQFSVENRVAYEGV